MNSWTHFFQDSNTPMNDMMIMFHDFAMMMLMFIIMFIISIMTIFMSNKFFSRFMMNNNILELIWTIFPMFILIIIAFPSIKILYMMEENYLNKLTIKSIGHQWYWSYEYTDFPNLEFNSFMIPTSNLKMNEFRLIDVDNKCIMPFNFPLRILTTSMDVIHAWTVPSLGIKMDSVPGRLNQSFFIMNRPGLYYGQCSEICGINHSFMPISIESTNFMNFKNWLIFMSK